jgi:hypothetical protein
VAILPRRMEVEDASGPFPPTIQRLEIPLRRSSDRAFDGKDVDWRGGGFDLRSQTGQAPRERVDVASLSQGFERLT